MKKQPAKIFFQDGRANSITLLNINNEKVTTERASYRFDTVASIEAATDGALIYFPANRAFARVKQAKFVNYTALPVTVTLHSAWTHQGREIVLHADRTKNNLEVFAELLGGRVPSGEKPVSQWTLRPGQEVPLTFLGHPILTNRVVFNTQTEHGKTVHERVNAKIGSEFVIAIDDEECHSPVFVKVGEWKVEQDVSYTVVRGRTPDTAITTPVTGLFSTKIKGFETRYYEGQDYEYERRNNGGIATATAEVENPTDKPMSVSITLQFDFMALILSHEQVSTRLELPARSKGLVRLEVNTKGFFENRAVTGVKQLDVTNTPK